jgi:hypothetical protein
VSEDPRICSVRESHCTVPVRSGVSEHRHRFREAASSVYPVLILYNKHCKSPRGTATLAGWGANAREVQ